MISWHKTASSSCAVTGQSHVHAIAGTGERKAMSGTGEIYLIVLLLPACFYMVMLPRLANAPWLCPHCTALASSSQWRDERLEPTHVMQSQYPLWAPPSPPPSPTSSPLIPHVPPPLPPSVSLGPSSFSADHCLRTPSAAMTDPGIANQANSSCCLEKAFPEGLTGRGTGGGTGASFVLSGSEIRRESQQ